MSSGDCPGQPGDLIIFERCLKGFNVYDHYAVNVGNGDIIHATSLSDDQVGSFDVSGCCSTRSKIAMIKKVKFRDFVKPGDRVSVENSVTWRGRSSLPIREIIERACSRIGERDYSVLWNNCEHFARWCRYGKEKSGQAEGLLWAGAAVIVGFVLGILGFGSQGSKEKEKKS